MKQIIVPTDFSTVSLNAVTYAMNMAKDINASLVLFHAYQVPVTFSEVPVVTASIEQLQSDSQEKLEELKKNLEHISSGPMEILIENRLGDVVEELADLCEDYQPFAVVMGTKGSGTLERLIIGSNTISAIKRLTTPVIIIPPGSGYRKIKKIGFACDFNHVKETTPVEEIGELLKNFGATLHVLNVDYRDRHFTAEKTQESEYLHELLQHLHPSYHYINSINVEEGINNFSDANGIDLLITIPKKHGFMESIFRRSQSSELVLHSHLPIAAIHE